MKKLLTLLLVLVASVGWCAGTTTETSGKSTIQTGPASFTNFVQLGELSPILKFKILTGVASDTAGVSSDPLTHGLTNSTKVVFACTMVDAGMGGWVFPGHVDVTLNYGVYLNNTAFYVQTNAAATTLRSKAIRIIVGYIP